ncbi:MAG: hypothetical protein PHI64_15215 [Zoogloea sp.]|uniref:hypothetical protein n=1 Tax=Zoogloea sp. TaxID=49181 RepID=UPI002611499A|nr:hypothetical protein [Zoogloea sp.]MDD2990302.1 hypothetical protein [Zoogloea sp.]
MKFRRTLRSLLLVGLALPLVAGAAPVLPGNPLPALSLEDQHGKLVSTRADTRTVLFAADKAGSDLINEVLAAQPEGVLATLKAVYFADISAMPALVTRMFALPALREMPFAVGLGRDAAQLADLPRQKGAATILRVADGKVTAIEYAHNAGQLMQAIGLK